MLCRYHWNVANSTTKGRFAAKRRRPHSWTQSWFLPALFALAGLAPAVNAQVGGANPITSTNAAITGAAMPTTPSVPGLPQPGMGNIQGPGTGSPFQTQGGLGNGGSDSLLPGDALPADLGTPANPLQRKGGNKAERPKDSTKDLTQTTDQGPANREQAKVVYTEFQKYVYESTGQVLPIFGAHLFGQGNRFAALQTVPVPADYVLGPGDEVIVRMWGMIDAEFRLPIDREGQVSIPKVGTFSLLGVRAADLESALRAQIGKSFTNFHLNATLGQLRSMQVYLVGQAAHPGLITTSSLSTLISVLFESGGPAPTGSMRAIELRREGKLVSTLDLYDFLVHGNKSADAHLLPGDVIVIPPAGPSVAVLGPISSPAIYELKSPTEPLQETLIWAGGTTVLTSLQKAQLERLDPANPRAPRLVQNLVLDTAGLAQPLRDGDVLTFFKLAPAFSNAVTLRGNVAAPLRYPFKPGMKLSDLIPDRDALLVPDYFVRKNILVQFDDPRAGIESSQARQQIAGTQHKANDVLELVDELNWDYAVIERLEHDNLKTQLIPFDLGQLVLRKDPAADLPLQPGDVVTVFSVHDMRVPRNKRGIYVRVEGEVQRPGIYPMHAGDTLATLAEIAGGLTPDAYLYGAEFTREEARRSQQAQMDKVIGKLEAEAMASIQQGAERTALDAADAAQAQMRQQAERANVMNRLAQLRQLKATGRINLGLTPQHATLVDLPAVSLEDADRLYVPGRPAFVQVLGSVNIESALLWKKGQDVGDYLRQAGIGKFADKDAIFVIRADGSISDGESRTFGGVRNLEIQPGDTIVVPEVPDKATGYDRVMRTLKDIAVIFQGFGIGVAALKAVGL